jgi:hypothetical protein
LLLVPLLLAVCDGPGLVEGQLGPCVESREFGSSGCAVLEVAITPPSTGTSDTMLAVSARLAEGSVIAHADQATFGKFHFRLELPPESTVAGGDTASVWVVAKLVDIDASTGGATHYVAADSVLRVIRFTAVGETPPVELVRLTLRTSGATTPHSSTQGVDRR